MTGVARVTVQGTAVDGFGQPVPNALVTFTPSFPRGAVETAAKLLISAEPCWTRTDEAGAFSIELWPTDDDRISPTGFTYRVDDAIGRCYSIVVPMDTPGGVLDLADVVPVDDPSPGVAQLLTGATGATGPAGPVGPAGAAAPLTVLLLTWAYAQSFQLVSAIRDANEAIATASIRWPDDSTGTFTTTTASTSFLGAIDAYVVTYVPTSGPTKTITQAAVTRDSAGAVIAQPALAVV